MENLSTKIPRDRLLIRELFTALTALVLLGWLALLVPAPLAGPGGVGVPAETAVQAPWIFVGLQVLLAWLPPLWGGVLPPLVGLAFLALLPLEKRLRLTPGISSVLFMLLLLSLAGFTLYGYFE